MKHTMKTLLSVLLALTMAVGLLPGMLSTAHADGYCPNRGSTYFGWDYGFDMYYCDDCCEWFDNPSDTPLAAATPIPGDMRKIITPSRPPVQMIPAIISISESP
ncbi:MAG: hypothetical protein IJQ62_15450 [Clostridia bacterium]|nr:hypothetical protein [Clostridia bacterium]